jgi:hypothetical protein
MRLDVKDVSPRERGADVKTRAVLTNPCSRAGAALENAAMLRAIHLEKYRTQSIFPEPSAARDTNDTNGARKRNTRNATARFHTRRSRAVHAFGDFKRRLVISY